MKTWLTILRCVFVGCIAHLSVVSTAYAVVITGPTTISASNTAYEGQNLVVDGATVTINGTHQFNDVQLLNGAVLTHSGNAQINLTGRSFFIDASSSIDVTAKGNPPTTQVTGTAGGSYGGLGGLLDSSSTTNPVFGSHRLPVDLGIGGIGSAGITHGGGRIKLIADVLTVNGDIIAMGSDFTTFFRAQGAGSGGSILLDVGTLKGTGTLQASGGSGFTFYGGGGGGGGRIAIYYDSAVFDFNNNIINEGGVTKPNSGQPGQPGTIYIEQKVSTQPPSVDAGPSLAVDEQTEVTLSGSATDADGTITGYAWTQLSGPHVTINDADTTTPYFTAPVVLVPDSPTVLTFRLSATDNDGLTATSETTVGVFAVNEPPLADAGTDLSVNENTDVSLQGTGSDSDGDVVEYNWVQTGGTSVTLISNDSATASFTSPTLKNTATLEFQLTVTDNESATSSDTVQVTVNPVNTLPVAGITAAETVAENTSTTLDGSPSFDPDVDGFIASYDWTQISGPSVVLSNTTGEVTSFIAPPVYQDTALGFRLDIVDDEGGNASATTYITVYSVNPDDDIDGMPDVWEIDHFGDLDNDGSADSDNDGVSDLEEYNLDTDPTVEQHPGQPQIVSPDDTEVTALQPDLVITNPDHHPAFPVSYEFEVYRDESMTDLVTSTGDAGLTWTVNTALDDNTRYYWRARAVGTTLFSEWVSSTFFVNTSNDAPGAFDVSYPGDGVQVDTFTPTLSVMNSVDIDGDSITYRFEVYIDGILVTAAEGIPAGLEGTTSWTVDVALAENSWYQWRAVATDEHGLATTSSTEPMIFVNIFNEAPEQPVIDSPVNGSEITTLYTDLVVNNADEPEGEAVHYVFELDTVNTFNSTGKQSSGIVYETPEVSRWSVSELLDNTWYYWRAKASDGRAESPWVNGRFFVNQFNDAPGIPVARSPGDGAWTGSLQPTLEVYPVDDIDGDSVSYEFRVYRAGKDGADYDLVTSGNSDTTFWQLDVTLNETGYYYWHARAIDEHGLASDWGDIVMFFADEDGVNDTPEISLKRLVYGKGNVRTIHTRDNGQIDYRHSDRYQRDRCNGSSNKNQYLVRIKWRDYDPDSNASISLYYDTDRYGEDGVLIQQNISEDPDGLHDHYNWDIRHMQPGIYFVYAIIDDGENSSIAYSENAVIVGDGGGRPFLTFNPSAGKGEQKSWKYIKLGWHDFDSDSNAVIGLYYDTDNTGFDGYTITDAIQEDPDGYYDQYYWDVSSLDEGKYYVYATITDGFNTYRVYADNPVEIINYRRKK